MSINSVSVAPFSLPPTLGNGSSSTTGIVAVAEDMKASQYLLTPLCALAPGLGRCAAAATSSASADGEKCSSLVDRLQLDNTTVYSTSFIPAGTNLSLAENDPTCGPSSQLVRSDICRVTMLITTSPSSNISFEAWLPLDWSGRFLGTGNGGLNGCIHYDHLDYGSLHGFATVGTNNGHNGTSGRPFYENPGVLEDYVYRSIHLEAELGKQIARQFYGREHTKSYYLGCSTGGRQGFKSAHDFPSDFDGIVAGAPAFSLNALMYWTGQMFIKTGSTDSPRFLDSAAWDLVYADILEQCDGLDGLEDGILEDPDLCQYRPENLLCGSGRSSGCLTGEQAETVRAIFSPVYGADGELVYPRFQPGANSTAGLFAGAPHPYPTDWFRYVVYGDETWDPATLNVQDWVAADELNPFNSATWEGDLSAARDAGTKILHYHGLQDPAISSDNSARYYDYVSRTMDASSDDLDGFYRYFRISGLGHCNSGSGANLIGADQDTYATYDPDANVLAAVVRWVEDGVAPDHILGSRKTAAGKTDISRRHCRYPRRNRYKGEGDPAVPDSWECVF